MIEPYQAIGLVPTMRGIRRRADITVNLEHISHLIKAASWLSSLDLPVRLIAIPEGALQGFNDEVLDLDHETFARECAIDVPGPETDYLGKLARQWNAFVMAQAKARHPEFPGRFFNVGFVLDPDGEIVLKHHKVVPLLPVEHSVTPHNVWDKWIELYGRTLDAFYPVADTAIGRLGFLMANEGSYPENARGLAMNGAEVVYRGPYPHPHTGNGLFEIQNRARALDNNLYLIACNVGTYYLDAESDVPIDTFGGGSAVIDYRGQVIGRHAYSGGSSWVAGTVDVEALRRFRAAAQWDNWLKDLTTEQYQLIYEQPVYPKNLYLDRAPYTHAEYRREVIDRQVRLMHERDIWAQPDNGSPEGGDSGAVWRDRRRHRVRAGQRRRGDVGVRARRDARRAQVPGAERRVRRRHRDREGGRVGRRRGTRPPGLCGARGQGPVAARRGHRHRPAARP
jgi:predicted amidohydrolase